MLDSNTALVKQFLDRRRVDDARFYTTTMIFDAYYTMNKKEWIDQENKEYRDAVEKRFYEYYKDFGALFNSVDEKSKLQIVSGIRNRMFGEGLMLETITFADWIKSIKEKYA